MAAVRPAPAAGLGVSTPDANRDDQPPALQVKNLTAGYGAITNGRAAVTVLRDIDIAIRRGHVVGVIGESGCGKATPRPRHGRPFARRPG